MTIATIYTTDATPASPRVGKELMNATRQFSVEVPWRSWWSVTSTLIILTCTLGIAAIAPWWPLRLAASVLGGLVLVRSFILYHDYMHRSLLRDSRLAKPIFHLLGYLLLTPPRYWRHTHNYHHGNTGKPLNPDDENELLYTSDVGSFPLMTTERWRAASRAERLQYRIYRHPITMLLAYITVFFFSATLLPFLKDPRKHWDGALAIVLHGAVIFCIWFFAGFDVLFFAFLLPFAISAATGSYLFFAQHNYEGMHILEPEEWTYYRGALESSSFLRLNRLMNWFTGNIGYHHIHHLNPLIPFYRLPEAMAAIPELRHPVTTSLKPRDIYGCLRLNLWDREKDELVTYRAGRLGT
ncbi:MAG: fatty acid desaturase family protein [Phycisphaerales bacterium]